MRISGQSILAAVALCGALIDRQGPWALDFLLASRLRPQRRGVRRVPEHPASRISAVARLPALDHELGRGWNRRVMLRGGLKTALYVRS